MALILPGIHTLEQHQRRLQVQPQDYRPERCPHCGKAGVWCHGAYARKADREGRCDACLNPVPIPRFFCPHCQATCSRLPQCLAPRRWYGWAMQQAVLWLLAGGRSIRGVSRELRPSRRTVGRWRQGFQSRFPLHAACLRSRFPQLGHHEGFHAFWGACLTLMPLSLAMVLVHQSGVAVP